jgi:hypothetical protein
LRPSAQGYDTVARELGATLEAGLRKRRGVAAVSKQLETPLQRYHRLLAEVTRFQSELQQVADADARRPAGSTAVAAADNAVWSSISGGTTALAEQLSRLQAQAARLSAPDPAMMAPGGPSTAVGERLQTVLQSLQPLDAAAGTARPAAAPASPVPGRVAGTSSLAEALSVADMEARVARIEAALGVGYPETGAEGSEAAIGGHGPAAGLTARLQAVEQLLGALTPAALADVTAQAERATAALRALSAAWSAASADVGAAVAAGGNGGGGYLVAEQRVRTAVETVERWDAVAAALPALVSRLASLDVVHRDAALFAQRVRAAETQLASLEGALSSDAAVLREVQEGLRAAAGTVQDNVAALQARIAAVQARLP